MGRSAGGAPSASACDLGYRLVGSNIYGFNVFFARNDVGVETLPTIGLDGLFRHGSQYPRGTTHRSGGRLRCRESTLGRPGLKNDELALERTVATRAFRGGLWQGVAQIAPFAFTLVISIIAARILGPDQMGRRTTSRSSSSPCRPSSQEGCRARCSVSPAI